MSWFGGFRQCWGNDQLGSRKYRKNGDTMLFLWTYLFDSNIRTFPGPLLSSLSLILQFSLDSQTSCPAGPLSSTSSSDHGNSYVHYCTLYPLSAQVQGLDAQPISVRELEPVRILSRRGAQSTVVSSGFLRSSRAWSPTDCTSAPVD